MLKSKELILTLNFNPRSLAGATIVTKPNLKISSISIHAPSRERLQMVTMQRVIS